MLLTHCLVLCTVVCPPVWSAVELTQPYRVLSTNGSARVQCTVRAGPSDHLTPQAPPPDPEELRVTLLRGLRGPQELCSTVLNLTDTETETETEEGQVQCSARLTEGAVEVSVSGLTAADTDLYRCVIEVFYPPPFLRLTGNGTLIHVLGASDCRQPQRRTAERTDGGQEDAGTPVSVPVVAVVILVVMLLLLAICLQALQWRRGRGQDGTLAPAVLQKVDAAAFPC